MKLDLEQCRYRGKEGRTVVNIPLGTLPPTIIPVVTTPTAPHNSSQSSNPALVAYVTGGLEGPSTPVQKKDKNLSPTPTHGVVRPSTSSQVEDQPPTKKVRKESKKEVTAFLYTWHILNAKGEEVRKCVSPFLAHQNCKVEYEAALKQFEQENGQVTGEIRSEKVNVPEPVKMAERVYHYLLKVEFRERVKKYCIGCQTKKGSSKSHSEGCMSAVKALAEEHGKAAHVRISSVRLHESCAFITGYFGQSEYVSLRCVELCLSLAKPVQVLQEGGDDSFESEYTYLKHY